MGDHKNAPLGSQALDHDEVSKVTLRLFAVAQILVQGQTRLPDQSANDCKNDAKNQGITDLQYCDVGSY